MSTCSISDCELDSYGEHNECILHCSKEKLDFFSIRTKFYKALDKYVLDNSINNYDFCRFYKIAFPNPDTQSDLNYIKILNNIPQINFYGCDFFVSHIELNDSKIFFHDCNFYENWTMYNYDLYSNMDDVIYINCMFHKKVETYISEKTRLYSYSCSQFDCACAFKGEIVFYYARFEMPPFNGRQDVCKKNSFNKFLIEDCEFIKFELNLLSQQHGNVEFKRCGFESKLRIRSVERDDYDRQQNNKSKLKSLKIIDCYVSDNAYVRIGYLDVETFLLSNLRNPQNSELNIGDCHFDSFKIRNFRNAGRFKLYKINVFGDEKGVLFQIDNTSIGDADFQSICLTSFSTVRFFDNIFVSINYTNMQWKEIIEVGEYNDIDITKVAKKRDTYRVLKNVAIRNNDQPQALLFYAREMQQHKKLTIESRCKQIAFKTVFLTGIFCKEKNSYLKDSRLTDIITLYFNEKTNNFGLNWWRPIWLLLLFSSIFYSSLLYSLDINIVSGSWKNIFEFMNPVHSTNFIAKGCWTGTSYFIDFLHRIVEGLLIFQIVVAFRKFTRK